MPFLSGAVSKTPSATALVDDLGSWSFIELAEAADGVARRLGTLMLDPGRPVALLGEATRAYVGALHGVWRAGLGVAPFNGKWTRVEEARAFARLEPSVALIGEGYPSPDLSALPPCTPVFRLGSGPESPLPLLQDLAPVSGDLGGLGPEDEAVWLQTSGTTGPARVVKITFGNLFASARGSERRLSLGPSDRWLGSLSLAHVGGVALISRAALLGSRVVLKGGFHAPEFATLVANGTVTHASLVPTMLRRYFQETGNHPPPESLRCLLIGGAPARPELIEAVLEAGMPLALTYGLTEASSQVATAEPALVRRKPGTVGLPLPGVEVRVSEVGEILVRGPTVVPGGMEEDGWLHTGDLGRLDAEGHLWVTGRISDRIISGGLTVDPSEVVSVIESHPLVEAAAVVGIPDEEWGERVVAAVVPASTVGPGLEAELKALADSALSSGKRPRAYGFLGSLPRNANGKVDREAIRAFFQ